MSDICEDSGTLKTYKNHATGKLAVAENSNTSKHVTDFDIASASDVIVHMDKRIEYDSISRFLLNVV